MFKKTSLLILTLTLSPTSPTPDNSTVVPTIRKQIPAKRLSQRGKTSIWYHSGPLPTIVDHTFELNNTDADDLNLESTTTLEQSKNLGIKALLKAAKANAPLSILFVRPLTNKSFVIEIKKSKTDAQQTNIKIYGLKQSCPQIALKIAKMCSIKNGLAMLGKISAAVGLTASVLTGGIYLAKRDQARRITLARQQQDAPVAQHYPSHPIQDLPQHDQHALANPIPLVDRLTSKARDNHAKITHQINAIDDVEQSKKDLLLTTLDWLVASEATRATIAHQKTLSTNFIEGYTWAITHGYTGGMGEASMGFATMLQLLAIIKDLPNA